MARVATPPLSVEHAPPALTAVLRTWLGAGLISCGLLEPAQWYHTWVGWLPFWLVAMPLLPLCILHRERIAAALGAILVRARRRRASAVRRRRPLARGSTRLRPTPSSARRLALH